MPTSQPYRVYYEDTDAGGVVYHANYLKFAERARADWLRDSGVEQSQVLKEMGLAFVVYRLEIDFLSPARLDDLLTVETRLLQKKGVTMKVEQIIKRDAKTMATLAVELACINQDGKPTRWPEVMTAIA